MAKRACAMNDEDLDAALNGDGDLLCQTVQAFMMNGRQRRLFGDETTAKLHHDGWAHGGSTALRFMRVPRED